jgi:nucleotide-binding universal stress UspA family protein
MERLVIKNVLVPIDFSDMSIAAIGAAKRLAQRFSATVHLAHVYEYYYPTGFLAPVAPIFLSPVTYVEDAVKAASKQLRKLAREHGLTGRCETRTGGPVFDDICRIAREIPADLIVTPTHGRTGLKHFFLGSTAERLVQHSPCPVFVAKKPLLSASRTGPLRIDKILVPVDFSRCSFDELEYAIQLASTFAAKIFVLNAVYLGYAYTPDGFAMYDLGVLEEAERKFAEREMAKFVRRAKFGRVKFETAVEIGPPVDYICAFAQNNGIDLIVIPTHGRTGFEHVMIGSTAEQVVRRASCPVWVVPSHPEIRIKQLARQARTAHRSAPTTARHLSAGHEPAEPAVFAQKYIKRGAHPPPERRQINKFRESHLRVKAGH